jgi:perosamine synthetase
MKRIPVANPFINKLEAREVFNTINSGWITMGKKVKTFEEKFAKLVHAKYALATNNGTSSLHLCLRAIKVQSGDEIIIPNITYISTINVVLYENALPVIVNSSPFDYNIDPDEVEKKITKKTKAIIGVDMHGLPFDYDKLNKIAKKYKIELIADSAEAFGASYKNKKIGTVAKLHSFSFFANKNITTAEGGMITTNNSRVYKKLKLLRNHGQTRRYYHTELGYNYRMTDITAAFGLVQLKKLKSIIIKKNNLAKRYKHYFLNHPYINIAFEPNYIFEHSWYNFTITVKSKKFREFLRINLDKLGIETRVSFRALSKQPFIKANSKINCSNLKKSELAVDRLLNIPIYASMTFNDQRYVFESIDKLSFEYFSS